VVIVEFLGAERRLASHNAHPHVIKEEGSRVHIRGSPGREPAFKPGTKLVSTGNPKLVRKASKLCIAHKCLTAKVRISRGALRNREIEHNLRADLLQHIRRNPVQVQPRCRRDSRCTPLQDLGRDQR